MLLVFDTGNSLNPSLTIICRIDTLEKPSMAARCVGFAVLKLCVDITGDQPTPNSTDTRIFLNAGQYRLPIVYGRVPAEGDFSEALMDQLPHVHDAYLNVRLFDPSVDTPASARPDDGGWSLNRDSGKYVDECSIAGSLIHAMEFATEPLKKLPIPDSFVADIKKGAPIGEGEKNVVLRQISEWMTQVFPPLRQKIPLIDPKFMLKYEDKVGSFCALDMLYNMPIRTDLLRSAKDGLDAMPSGVGKKFDNHIKYYKTYFRYLPGSIPGSSKKDSGKENIADLIIDDASLDLDLSSYEYNPVYNDDFSRTVGIELTQHACLLVVVTSVDILTSQRGALTVTSQTASPNISSRQNVNVRTGTRGTDFGDTGGGGRKDVDERAFKLRGLVGAYFGNHEPDAVWWGIVPLLVESPFQKRPTRAGKLKGSVPAAMPANRAMRKKNSSNGSLGDTGDAVMSFQEGPGQRGGPSLGLNLKVNQWTSGEEAKVRNSNSKLSEVEEKLFFVNAGTHQVPLFCGFPPEDLIKSPNPLGWLLSTLTTGVKSNDELAAGSAGSWFNFGICNSSSAVIDPSDADYNARRGKPMLKLSPGASAMVSVVDPRLRQFSNNSITRDPTIQIREDLIHKVLKARFLKHNPQTKVKAVDDYKRGQAQKMFKFKFGKVEQRTYQQAIPNNIYSETLMEEISKNFIRSISE